MAVSTNDLKNGMTLDLSEGLFSVVEFQHVKPGKGGAFVRTKLKNVRTGQVLERTYRADEKLEQAIIDKRDMQYLYRDADDYVFMDSSNYEQLAVPSASSIFIEICRGLFDTTNSRPPPARKLRSASAAPS